jgi:hypothetical protein
MRVLPHRRSIPLRTLTTLLSLFYSQGAQHQRSSPPNMASNALQLKLLHIEAWSAYIGLTFFHMGIGM